MQITDATIERASHATIATTRVPQLEARSAPRDNAHVVAVLPALTRRYLHPRTLLVTDRRPGWFETLLPIRPNGTTGWVRDTEVVLTTTTYRIHIVLAERMLAFFDGDALLAHAPIAVGRPELPTPTGTFSVTDLVDRTSQPHRLYGAFVLGLSGYSQLLSFRGGPGQIAIHGTSNPACLGREISRGCIRVANDTATSIGRRVPLGTPVTISS